MIQMPLLSGHVRQMMSNFFFFFLKEMNISLALLYVEEEKEHF